MIGALRVKQLTYIHTILLYGVFQFMLLSCLPAEETSLTYVKIETLQTLVSRKEKNLDKKCKDLDIAFIIQNKKGICFEVYVTSKNLSGLP